MNGCVLEAIKLIHNVPFEQLSISKTRAIFEKGVNVMDQDEAASLEGDDQQAILRVLKQKSQSYYDLTILLRAIEALESWRNMEQEYIV